MENKLKIQCPKCNSSTLTVNVSTIKCDTCGNLFTPDEGKISIDSLPEIEPVQNINSISEPSDAFEKKILDMCRNENVLQAVKYVKDTKNWGLKESKDYVDELCVRYGIQRGSGCSGKAAVLIIVFVCITILFVKYSA